MEHSIFKKIFVRVTARGEACITSIQHSAPPADVCCLLLMRSSSPSPRRLFRGRITQNQRIKAEQRVHTTRKIQPWGHLTTVWPPSSHSSAPCPGRVDWISPDRQPTASTSAAPIHRFKFWTDTKAQEHPEIFIMPLLTSLSQNYDWNI